MNRFLRLLLILPLLFWLEVAACRQEQQAVATPAPTVAVPPATTAPSSPFVPTVTARPTEPAATVTPVVTTVPTATPAATAMTLLPHYTISATLDYDAHRVWAEQLVTLSNNSDTAWTEVVFNVSPAYWPGLFTLQEATVVYAGSRHAPLPRWETTMLHLPLDSPLDPGVPLSVTLAFSLSLPPLDPVGWGPRGNAGWGPALTQVGDWYPALVPYRPGVGWDTWIYNAVGDPVRSGLADYDVTLTIVPTMTVAAPGRQEAAGHYRLQQARAFSFLASPEYVRLADPAGEVPLSVYVLAPHAESGPVVQATARQALTLFSELYGPYPYPELVIAENGFLTAMEYSALISLSGYGFDSYEGTADSLLVSITAHEVAHQWWYGAVGNDQVDEPWLDEALAMVSELLFYERYYPELVEWWWWYRVERWDPAGYVDVSVQEYADSATFVHDMYGMAAYFMRDLRILMGEEAFLRFLQAYYEHHRFGWVTGDDFFAFALAHADAGELTALVESYFREMPHVLQTSE